jgi:hypothetical protein
MSEHDDIQDLIADTAHDLVQAEPDPAKWADWFIYLAKCLECETTKIGLERPDEIELAFERLKDALADRLRDGRW